MSVAGTPLGFLLLQPIGQVFMESVEALFPEGAMLGDPVGGGVQWPRIEAAAVNSSLAAALHKPGLFQDFQVLRDSGERHVERLREVRDARLAEREPREDGATRRIREGGERPVERAQIVNHQVNY
jgi:hypothetical protein